MTSAAAHILVAEDEPDIRANLERLLRLEGYRVSVVADGRAAWAAVRTLAPDLLLTDLMMPGMGGEALLRALRADPAGERLPVLMLTARAGSDDHQRVLAAGADAVVTKPYQRGPLLACIRGLLDASGGPA